ncbi:MAG: aldo/keto reductase [Halobacteria archaeon]|nr:aldo/keto reductase [Halobacteria archaeon]
MTNSEIPKIGLGTSGNKDPEQCAKSVSTALDVGYRHVDTAQAYENEEYVGNGIKRSEVPRDEVFLATKVHPENLKHDDVLESTEESLQRLGVDYVDILYVHWPIMEYEPEESIGAFNELHERDKIRKIGVSNFTPELLKEAIEISDVPITANQLEMHPLLQQEELVNVTQKHGVEIVAYSPLGKTEIFDTPELVEVAEKHDATVPQVCLAWLMSIENVHPIPKATGDDHIRENYESLNLDLDENDKEKIDNIGEKERLIDPDYSPW